ncbi:hypothetical protein [Arcobacter peruensis]|uniref:hypothetical protein n=1 Tax=Arcobacter peruensis TaxID=2320140 RepID=UPI000F07B633|nr:hypothetical protein [Arcobacter peruensis]
MFNQKQTYFTILFLLVFSGCSVINPNKNIEVEAKNIEKAIVKNEIKKETKKTPIKKAVIKKKTQSYKYCNKHRKIMDHASLYIKKEFNKGYFIQKDILGAEAQLFLIESNSQSIFAKNINNALKSYNREYTIAKRNRCNLSKYKTSPINKVKLEIKRLKKEAK